MNLLEKIVAGILIAIVLLLITMIVKLEPSKGIVVHDITTTQTLTLETTTQIATQITTTRTQKTKIAKTGDNFKAFITHYGPNCKGCSGITASGYNVKNTIYYNDAEYGKLRVCAMSKKIKLYSVIEITNYKYGAIKCIVLDRGVSGNTIDILVENESIASKYGIQKNANVIILRSGR